MKPSKYNASTLEDILMRNNPDVVGGYIRERFYNVDVVDFYTASVFNEYIDIQASVYTEDDCYFVLMWSPQDRPFCMIKEKVSVAYIGGAISGLKTGVQYNGPYNKDFNSLYDALVFVKLKMAAL